MSNEASAVNLCQDLIQALQDIPEGMFTEDQERFIAASITELEDELLPILERAL